MINTTPGNPPASQNNQPIVDFHHVDVIFGNQQAAAERLDAGESRETIQAETNAVVAVHNATLQVQRGEVCVLMGLSGSGKSSLLRCVNGLNTISRGRLTLQCAGQSIDMSNPSKKELLSVRRQGVAMVFQQFGLLPWRSVRDNVAFGLQNSGMARREIAPKVDAILETVQLSQWADKLISELSGGMQQRVGLARAIVTDPDILLMDEPFSALDPLIRDHLQDELLKLHQTLQKTILFVSHDLDEALKIGDRIVLMESGKIIQIGTAAEIILNPATQYVRDFVAHINPLKILTADMLMQPIPDDENALNDAKTVSPTTPIETLLSLMSEQLAPVVVIDQQREPLGYVRPNDIFRALRADQRLATTT